MEGKGLRVDIDDRAEKIGYKIREARLQRIPYMLIVGEKEVKDRLVSVNKRDKGDIGQFKLDEFVDRVLEEVENKKINLFDSQKKKAKIIKGLLFMWHNP